MKFTFKASFEITKAPKKSGLRRLVGSFLTAEEAPPPQHAEVPAFEPMQIPGAAPMPEATELLEPRPAPSPSLNKSARMRANMSVREVAGLLRDPRIAKVVGPTDATYYLQYAGNNKSPAELAARMGVSEAGFKVLMEDVEKKVVIEAIALKKHKAKMAKYVRDGSEHLRTEAEDREAQERVERREYFDRPDDPVGECLHDDYGDEGGS
jgi:hypothetical protein